MILPTWERRIACLGALVGLAGVALSAAAAHWVGTGNVDTAARFLLVHAPALIGIACLSATGLAHLWAARTAGILMGLGLLLFCGDLTVRELYGVAPFRMAAPTGGILLMAGWLALALSAVLPRRD